MFGCKIQVNFSQMAHLAVANIELKALWKTNRLTTMYYLPKKKVSNEFRNSEFARENSTLIARALACAFLLCPKEWKNV